MLHAEKVVARRDSLRDRGRPRGHSGVERERAGLDVGAELVNLEPVAARAVPAGSGLAVWHLAQVHAKRTRMENRNVRLEANCVASSNVVRRRAGTRVSTHVAAQVRARHVLDRAVVVRVLAHVFIRVGDGTVRRDERGEAVVSQSRLAVLYRARLRSTPEGNRRALSKKISRADVVASESGR